APVPLRAAPGGAGAPRTDARRPRPRHPEERVARRNDQPPLHAGRAPAEARRLDSPPTRQPRLYHGILAPRARARARAVAHGAPSPDERLPTAAEEPGPDSSPPAADVSGTAPAEDPGDAKGAKPPQQP